MDSRTAAHTLSRIAAYLELRGENRFKIGAYEKAARAVQRLAADDLGPLHRSGTLAATPGLGPATLSVITDLIETGESSYLERLRAEMPEGLLELVRIPGLGIPRIQKIHAALGISTVEELEAAARDGRIAALPRFSAKTAASILTAIEKSRAAGAQRRIAEALAEADGLLDLVRTHPDVVEAALAGPVRRHLEVVSEVDIVATCRAGVDPATVARDFADTAGVRTAEPTGRGSVHLEFVDGTVLHIHCCAPPACAVARWRATGPGEHVTALSARLADAGYTLDHDEVRDADGRAVAVRDEPALYRLAGMAWIAPELRDDPDAVDIAEGDALPVLVTAADIRGVLHCHTDYSDGRGTIREMARAAQARGWEYIGISDHSQAAFYAGGLTPDRVLEQHAEIDAVNAELAESGFRVLKGIEADILGHPTGRLLLSRDPYAIDLDAVLDRAAMRGVAVEINADPHRLDLDWRHVRGALTRGITIEIGPDAHSERGLDYMQYGVGMARKGWCGAGDVLNARDVEAVLGFARKSR